VVEEQAPVPEPDESGAPVDGKAAPEQPLPALQPLQAMQILVRRAPRYRAFVLTGVLIGVIAAAAVVFSGLLPLHQVSSAGTVFLYFLLAFSLFGGLLGAGAAILVERRH
jgi:hypothetical protein